MKVVAHDDKFEPGTKDEIWIPAVCADGLVILTKDKAIVRHGAEYDALIRSKARQFVLTDGAIDGPTIANAFIRARRQMEKCVRTHRPPFVLSVSTAGNVARARRRSEDGARVAKGLRRKPAASR